MYEVTIVAEDGKKYSGLFSSETKNLAVISAYSDMCFRFGCDPDCMVVPLKKECDFDVYAEIVPNDFETMSVCDIMQQENRCLVWVREISINTMAEIPPIPML